ncbi:MAG: extracellular solute-binding protein [Chloroflexi bacterium]|nr:extracellular solute-binding protein [Chloroflexota bacterium]
MKKMLVIVTVLTLVGLLSIGPVVAQDRPNLSIVWFAWPPCDLLSSLVADYPDANVTVSCVPIGEWRNQIFADFAAQGGADLPILDSQFMGEAVAGSHLVDLTEFLQTELPFDDYNQTALSYYAEVPQGSGTYYSVPVITDTRMLVYRRDLFENPDVMAAYQAATGQELRVPQTWTELLQIAQFFKGSEYIENGFATHWINDGDLVQTAWNHILWSWGGELWDSATYQVEGVLNNEVGVQAVEFAQQIFQTAPDGAAAFGFTEVVSTVCNGSTAMIEIWYGFGAAFTSAETCEQSPNLGFAVVPGEVEHFISLGGQGISISAYSPNQEAAFAFVSWLQSDETQIAWVQGGGFPGRNSILASEEFLNAAPYNPTFAEAFQYVKDFWNIPEYAALLAIQGEYLNLAISGQMDAQEALDLIAEEQQAVLDEAYPDGPPAP